MFLGYSFNWIIGRQHRSHSCVVEAVCPLCSAVAVVKLPAPIRKQQPDDTTHVCHPSLGGCNHGFANGASK